MTVDNFSHLAPQIHSTGKLLLVWRHTEWQFVPNLFWNPLVGAKEWHEFELQKYGNPNIALPVTCSIPGRKKSPAYWFL